MNIFKSVQVVGEVFERADTAIEAWQLNTVPEEGDEEDEEDGEPVEDFTFLTGVPAWYTFKDPVAGLCTLPFLFFRAGRAMDLPHSHIPRKPL